MNDERRRAWAQGGGVFLLLCVLSAIATLRTGATPPRAETTPQAIALLTEVEACRQPGAAGPHAATLLSRAVARMDRYPFDARNGVVALSELAEARLCALRAADQAQAQLAQETSRRFTARIDADYRAHRARLHHALDTKQAEDVRRESRALLTLFADRNCEYTKWLRHLERGES